MTNVYCEKGMLHKEEYKGHMLYVRSSGICPCGYVRLNKGDELFGMNDDESNDRLVYVPHGGITYTANHLPCESNEDYWFIGWDYGHCGDLLTLSCDFIAGKQWTMEEIIAEAKKVIDSIVKD